MTNVGINKMSCKQFDLSLKLLFFSICCKKFSFKDRLFKDCINFITIKTFTH